MLQEVCLHSFHVIFLNCISAHISRFFSDFPRPRGHALPPLQPWPGAARRVVLSGITGCYRTRAINAKEKGGDGGCVLRSRGRLLVHVGPA